MQRAHSLESKESSESLRITNSPVLDERKSQTSKTPSMRKRGLSAQTPQIQIPISSKSSAYSGGSDDSLKSNIRQSQFRRPDIPSSENSSLNMIDSRKPSVNSVAERPSRKVPQYETIDEADHILAPLTPLTPNPTTPISPNPNKHTIAIQGKMYGKKNSSLTPAKTPKTPEKKETTIVFDMPEEVHQPEPPVAQINSWTLSFYDDRIENEYASFFAQNNMIMWRIGLSIGLLVAIVLFFHSGLYGHESIIHETMFMAFSAIFPLVALLCSSYIMSLRQKQTAKYAHQIGVFAMLLIGSVAISARHYVMEKQDSAYKTGLFYILMLMGAHVMLRIRYFYLVLSMPLLLTIYLVEEIVSIKQLESKNAEDLFISVICLTASMCVISSSSYKTEYASRQDFMNARSSAKTTSKLIEQLKKLHRTYSHQVADFDSPLEKSIMLVKSILADPSLQREHINSLAKLLALLKSGDLMTPDIEKQVEGGWVDLDKDQEAWLFSNLYRNRQFSRQHGSKPSFSQSDRIKQDRVGFEDFSPIQLTGKKTSLGGESYHPPILSKIKSPSFQSTQTVTPRKKSAGEKEKPKEVVIPIIQDGSLKRPSATQRPDKELSTAARRRPSLVQQMFKDKGPEGRRSSISVKPTAAGKLSLESLKATSQNHLNEKEVSIESPKAANMAEPKQRLSVNAIENERSYLSTSQKPYESFIASEIAHIVLSVGSKLSLDTFSKHTFLETLDQEIEKLPDTFVKDIENINQATTYQEALNTIKEGEEELGSMLSVNDKVKGIMHDAAAILSSPEEVADHISIVSLLENSGMYLV